MNYYLVIIFADKYSCFFTKKNKNNNNNINANNYRFQTQIVIIKDRFICNNNVVCFNKIIDKKTLFKCITYYISLVLAAPLKWAATAC